MALINIDNGALAKSSVLNDNFIFLDEKIAKTAQTLDAKIGLVSNNASTVTSKLANTQTTVNKLNDDLTALTESNEGKASKDLSDVEITNSFVENIATKLAPNYNAGFSISSGWTATASGWLSIEGYSDASGVSFGYIDGKTIYENYQWSGDGRAGGLRIMTMAFIGKGQVFTNSNNGTTTVFYPCKGG